MTKFFSLLLLIGFAACNAMNSHQVMIPHKLGKVSVTFDDGFKVHKDGTTFVVEKAWTDKALRNISKEKLAAYLEQDNYLTVDQLSDGQYTVKGKSRIKGGGVYTGYVAYWAVKSGLYGLGAVGAGAALLGAATTVPTLAPVYMGGSLMVGAMTGGGAGAVATGVGTGLAFTAATGTTGMVAATAVTAALAEATVATTAAAVTTTGCVSGVVLAVETASLAAGALGTACWFLP